MQTVIPVGWASKLGAYSGAVLAIVALATGVLDGDHSAETLTSLAGAVILLGTTIAGRMAQAYAIYRDNPGLPALIEAGQAINAPYPPSDAGTAGQRTFEPQPPERS